MVLPSPGPEASTDAQPAAPPTAPAVVAVVVARDPGPWFETAVAAVAGQDYPNLSVLVIDAASRDEVKPRVGRAAPGAFVRRLDENPGFGAAANEVIEVVEGAAFYLLCHDDIAPEPDALRLMVEEAFRSNAAVIGPKLVAWDEPRRLLQVGEAMDRAGYVSPLIERGELDQAQHDAVRDVFVVPGACTLVRADLFAEIGGFDEGIDFHYDDVSLCWRARVAGARVIVAPAARVRHLEALGARRAHDDRRRLQSRHRLRTVMVSSSGLGLLLSLPRLAVLNVFEIVYSLVVGRTRQARDVASSWFWNLRRLGDVLAARRAVRSFRRVPDRDVREAMAGGSARLNQFLRGQIGTDDDRFSGLARSGRGMAGVLRSGTFRVAAMVWAGVALVLLAGSRHLLTRGVPAVGELVEFSSSPLDLLRAFASGWRTAGLGSESPAPTAFGLLGTAGIASLGAMGMLRTFLTVGLIPLGAIGAYHLARPSGTRHAQIAALLIYIANPLPYNALANGRWGALALYAAAPTVVGLLARASHLAPFGHVGGEPGPSVRPRRLRSTILALGVVTTLVATVAPVAVPIVVVMALALVVGSLLVYSTSGSGRMLMAALGAAAVAVVLHLPWSLDLILPGTPLSATTGPDHAARVADLAALLRFDVGPLGAGPIGYALMVAAALPLLIGRAERHAWAVRGWTLAVVFWGLAWVEQRGDLPFALPPAEVLLAPAAIGLALSAAMGVAAFEVDLPGYRFGWRQVASGLAAVAVVVAAFPVLGSAFDGRWSMPAGDHNRALGFIDAANDEAPFRVLWIGDPAALPLAGWELAEGVAYATTDAGTPRVEDLWIGSDEGRTGLLADAVELARSGQTARLGRLLAPMGVRYIAVPEQLAPAPFSIEPLPLPRTYRATLAAQLDLVPVDVPAGLSVFRNEAFIPTRVALPGDVALPTSGGISAAADLDVSDARAVLPVDGGNLRWTGELEGDTSVLLSAAHSERWQLEVDGRRAEQSKPFGWSNGFAVTDGGAASLRFVTPPLRYAFLLVQALLWVWALRSLLRARFGPDRAGSELP